MCSTVVEEIILEKVVREWMVNEFASKLFQVGK